MKKQLFDYNFREINRKIVLLEDISENFYNYEIKKLKNPFLGYVYIDIDCGLNVRIIGNLDDSKLIKKLCTKEVNIIRNDLLSNYKVSIYDKKINTYDLEEQMDLYYLNENINKVRSRKEIDHLRNKEYPDDVTIIVPFEDFNEQLWIRLIDYNEENKLYIGYLLNDSYKDNKLVYGTFVASKLIKVKEDNILVIYSILKKREN